MDYEASLKFAAWVAEHFGFLALLVLILLAACTLLAWRVWKGLESAIIAQTRSLEHAISEQTKAMNRVADGLHTLSMDVREMENSTLVSVLNSYGRPEYVQEATKRQEALHRRQNG